MKENDIRRWRHEHAFGQDVKRPGESRTLAVIVITALMMVVEIVAGIVFGSMALLADGLHMASHAVALGINFFAYIYARRRAHDPRFSFGTGKVNALGGYTGAILLAGFALLMAWESFERMLHPTAIAYNQAIFVAVLGLAVNGASMLILGHEHNHNHEHDHEHEHHHEHAHDHDHGHAEAGTGQHDHNLRSAYLHVLADALTSLTAIFALLTAKYFGVIWMDPLMGILGSLLVARWAAGLLRTTCAVMLDWQGPETLRRRIVECIEACDGARVTDLHLWSIGPGIHAVILTVAAERPWDADEYKRRLPREMGLAHVTIEVHGIAPGNPTRQDHHAA